MTLCVGPGTPASVCMVKTSSSSSSSSSDGNSDDSNNDDSNDDDDNDDDSEDSDDDDEDEGGHKEEQEDDEHNHHDDSDCEELSDGEDSQWLQRQEATSVTRSHAERAFMDWMDDADDDSDGDNNSDEDDDWIDPAMVGVSSSNNSSSTRYVPSIRHGGCINTAAWLTSPWRVSTCGASGSSNNNGRGNGEEEFSTLPSDDCPTQLITSGDDRQVKFWDVRHAMGTSNPLPGGKNTVCPFSSEVPHDAPVDAWKDFHSKSVVALSGSVIPLAAVYTRHRGNVFHVTPLDHDPGKVVTCGADGYLRCSDLESQTSTTIVSPEYDQDNSSTSPQLASRAGMCFSHHFVDANTGLLCSERGLRRFDMRVNPREQQMRSVLSSDTCKACAVWSKGSQDSAYVFASGTSADVVLYDLRMVSDGGPPSKKVQLYRPRGLSEDAKVSVSGIDISKNKRELLVSYENDQIYSFPICPRSSNSAAGPTVDELTELSNDMEEEETVQHELCAYGGHLNRYTFLKNAKYAGPNDEYICTGSDSGHAWIYNKYNGSVVSFLNADHSTCNGVIPHPTLPLFITYGIDSTAKIWRATTPVDSEVDDSPTGRARFYYENKHYNRTPLVSSWSYCKEKLAILKDDNICVMPDEIPSTAEMCDRGLFGGLGSIFLGNRRRAGSVGHGDSAPFIGNDLRNLAVVLRQNLFSCILAHDSDDDEPVRSSLNELKRRMSIIRLNYQAARKGLIVDPDTPWQLRAAQWHSQLQTTDSKQRSLVKYGDPVDQIPESPCDWIPYDPEMTGNTLGCGPNFNVDDYEDFYRQYYSGPHALRARSEDTAETAAGSNKRKLDSQEVGKAVVVNNASDAEAGAQQPCAAVDAKAISVTPEKSQAGSSVSKSSLSSASDEEEDTTKTPTESVEASRSLKVLHDTVLLLKEAGNTAQKAGLPSLAARRYDQAVQYCAIVFLEFPRGDLDIYAARAISNNDNSNNGSEDIASLNPRRLQWSPLLKLLITTRLNLSMVLLKLQHNPEPRKAADLAMTALFELGPFVMQKGQIRKGRRYVDVHKRGEPHETYQVAKELQAKGYFRLGSAQCDMGNHADAVKSFEHSIKSTKAISNNGTSGEPESIVLRRLAEAKRVSERKSKKLRKKLKAAMFGVCEEAGTPANSSSAEDGQKEKTSGEEGKQEDE